MLDCTNAPGFSAFLLIVTVRTLPSKTRIGATSSAAVSINIAGHELPLQTNCSQALCGSGRDGSRLDFIQPERVVRCHVAGVRFYRTWLRRPQARGQEVRQLRELILCIATENGTWGMPRIHGELKVLGFNVSERTRSTRISSQIFTLFNNRWGVPLTGTSLCCKPSTWRASLIHVTCGAARSVFVFDSSSCAPAQACCSCACS
jgi:hypothetical protein